MIFQKESTNKISRSLFKLNFAPIYCSLRMKRENEKQTQLNQQITEAVETTNKKDTEIVETMQQIISMEQNPLVVVSKASASDIVRYDTLLDSVGKVFLQFKKENAEIKKELGELTKELKDLRGESLYSKATLRTRDLVCLIEQRLTKKKISLYDLIFDFYFHHYPDFLKTDLNLSDEDYNIHLLLNDERTTPATLTVYENMVASVYKIATDGTRLQKLRILFKDYLWFLANAKKGGNSNAHQTELTSQMVIDAINIQYAVDGSNDVKEQVNVDGFAVQKKYNKVKVNDEEAILHRKTKEALLKALRDAEEWGII